jgi:hypothetical protein
MNKFVGLLAILILSAAPAFAWPACSGNWIQVPAGTSTANGAVVTENDQTFQCQQPSTPVATGSSGASNSASNSTSASNSNSSATGGSAVANGGSAKSSSTASGGSATGGNATGGSVGPISNINKAQGGAGGAGGNATATGGAGGQGGSSQAVAGNSSSGSGNSTSINETTNVAADRFPANTAYAAAPYPTAQCFKGYGVGGQSTAFGFSVNGGKIDENCAILETARSFDGAGERLAACKVKISNKYAKKAGVTLEDCMKASESVLLQQPIPAPVVPLQQPTPIIVNLPAPVINITPAPVIIQQTPSAQTPAPAFVAPKPHRKIKPPAGSGIKPCPVGYSKTDICLEND